MRSCLKYCLVLLLSVTLNEGSFRCDYKHGVVAKGWLKHFVVPATWFDARLRCALEGAVLASPTTAELKAEMTKFFNSTETQRYEVFTGIHATFAKGAYHTVEDACTDWIGLFGSFLKRLSQTWSDSHFIITKLNGIPLSKISQTWAPNEPDNKDDKESCLTLNSYGDLADLSCEETRPFICYRSENKEVKVNECGTFDPEYCLDNRTNKCYKFHTVPRNFSRAFLTCAAEGGHLAIINSDTEAKVLSELFSKYPELSLSRLSWTQAALISIHDWNEQGDWRTIHGQTLKEAGYSRFAPGEPNNAVPGQQCGAIFRSGLLDDIWCDRIASFICEKTRGYPDACILPENVQ